MSRFPFFIVRFDGRDGERGKNSSLIRLCHFGATSWYVYICTIYKIEASKLLLPANLAELEVVAAAAAAAAAASALPE